MRDPRRHYEARVVVVPLGISARRAVDDMGRIGLGGVVCLEYAAANPDAANTGAADNGHVGGYRLASVGSGGPAGNAATSLEAALGGADMVVFIGVDLREVDHDLVAAVDDAARRAGDLVAAVTIGAAAEDDAARWGLAGLRERVDMLLSVRSIRFAASFLDVVRGGRRDPAPLSGRGDPDVGSLM